MAPESASASAHASAPASAHASAPAPTPAPAPAPAPTQGSRILVIKLGALGDFVQALGPFAAIRRHHAADHLTLLTTAPFEEFAAASRLFDAVRIDRRPKGLDVKGWLGLRCLLKHGRFRRVYDLQTSDRSSAYFRLFWPGPYPEWSGIARGCSHPHANPHRDALHTMDRQAEQLRLAGIAEVPPPDLSWVSVNTARFGLARPYALLVPGGAVHRPAKRWPLENFAAIARDLAARGIQPVLLGDAGDARLVAAIGKDCRGARGLAGETSLMEVAALARGAECAVGNDTGPMHLAAAGCPSVVLFSGDSDPALCAPRGPRVTLLRHDPIADLSVDEVRAALTGAALTGD